MKEDQTPEVIMQLPKWWWTLHMLLVFMYTQENSCTHNISTCDIGAPLEPFYVLAEGRKHQPTADNMRQCYVAESKINHPDPRRCIGGHLLRGS